jgi:hypothetical protein
MLGGTGIIQTLSALQQALPVAARPIGAVRDEIERLHFRSLRDRQVFDRDIAPEIMKRHPARLLYVGVRSYTHDILSQLESADCEVWTTDIDPAVEIHGVPDRHVSTDISRTTIGAFGNKRFDSIILNGIIGHGVNEEADINRLARTLWCMIRPSGLLVVGWNTDKSLDPMAQSRFAEYFSACSLGAMPPRVCVPQTTHVYDFLMPLSDA